MEIGSRVVVVGGKNGIVRFMGNTDFAQGEWVGVELDTPEGKNDGEIHGVRYFTCAPNHGLFAKKSQVRLARASLGAGSTPPPTPLTASSRLQQMKEKRAALIASSSFAVKKSTSPRVSEAGNASASSPLTRRSNITHGETPSSSSSASAVCKPQSTTARVTSLKPELTEAQNIPSAVDEENHLAELEAAKQAIGELVKELEGKKKHIEQLEAALEVSQTETEAVKAALAETATMADKVMSAPVIEANDDDDDHDHDVAKKKAAAREADVENAGVGSQEYVDKAVELATSNLRKDFENQMSMITREWEEKESSWRQCLEKQSTELSVFQNEVVALRSRNAQLIASEQSHADELARVQAKVQSVTRKADQYAQKVTALEDALELLTLEKETLQMDKEIAEERLEECETEIEQLKWNQEVLIKDTTDDRKDMSSITTATAKDDHDHEVEKNIDDDDGIENENKKLRAAIKALHDRYAQEKAEQAKALKDALKRCAEYSDVTAEKDEWVAKCTMMTQEIEDLKEMLDVANAYESMVETLTEKNLTLGDRVADLEAQVASLESLRDMSDEMEYQHEMLEKELRAELGHVKDSMAMLQGAYTTATTRLEDQDRTIARFRDLVHGQRDEMAALREKLRMEAGELETMKESTQVVLHQSVHLRTALRSAKSYAVEAAHAKCIAREKEVENQWFRSIVPSTISHEKDEKVIRARCCLERLLAKAEFLIQHIVHDLIGHEVEQHHQKQQRQPPSTMSTDLYRSTTTTNIVLDMRHFVFVSHVGHALLLLRNRLGHQQILLEAASSEERLFTFVARLNMAVTRQLESHIDAMMTAVGNLNEDGLRSSHDASQPSPADRFLPCCQEWLHATVLIGSMIEERMPRTQTVEDVDDVTGKETPITTASKRTTTSHKHQEHHGPPNQTCLSQVDFHSPPPKLLARSNATALALWCSCLYLSTSTIAAPDDEVVDNLHASEDNVGLSLSIVALQLARRADLDCADESNDDEDAAIVTSVMGGPVLMQLKAYAEESRALMMQWIHARHKGKETFDEKTQSGGTPDESDTQDRHSSHQHTSITVSNIHTALTSLKERVMALYKNDICKGALTDAMAACTQDIHSRVLSVSSYWHVRANSIRNELMHAAASIRSLEETTLACATLQSRVKELEKLEGQSRVIILKLEQDLATLTLQYTAEVAAKNQLASQLTSEQMHVDQLLREKGLEYSTLEAANRQLRKQLKRLEQDHPTKSSPAPKSTTPTNNSNSNSNNVITAEAHHQQSLQIQAMQRALADMYRSMQFMRQDIARERLKNQTSFIRPTAPSNFNSPAHHHLTNVIQSTLSEIAAVQSQVLAATSMPRLIDLTTKQQLPRPPLDQHHERQAITTSTTEQHQQRQYLQIVHAYKQLRDRMVETAQREAWTDIEAAVKAGEVGFGNLRNQCRLQEHSRSSCNSSTGSHVPRHMGRLRFPFLPMNDDVVSSSIKTSDRNEIKTCPNTTKTVKIVLSAREMKLLSQALVG